MAVAAIEIAPMVEYRCSACRWWLFSSNVTYGKVEVTCGNRRCGRRQTVYLGGQRKREDTFLLDS